VTAAWLGHATVLINFYGLTILTDPVLYKRIGANTSLGTIGPRRLVAAPLKPSQLPPIDLVVISHAHMDHLDPSSLRSLRGHPRAVTARATTDLLNGSSIRKAHALSWDEQVRLNTRHGEILVRAFEVRHWGARWRYDTHRGYNGYILEREGKRILFGGDTAMCGSFEALKKYGPFDLAIMPIGAYHPWVHSHCNPEEAVAMANAAGSAYFLPIHFKTFPLGRERREEPLERLKEAIEPDRLAVTEVGQTFLLPTS
jgi:L-ascorbate metabolism protein UlaG (beta-lactamase superfamily)